MNAGAWRAIAVWSSLLVLPGCAEGPVPIANEEAEFALDLDGLGKADGSGLLSPEDTQRIADAFQQVIDAGEVAVGELEREIADLEAENTATLTQIETLLRQIEDRRDELERQHRDNLLLCAFVPNPTLCSIVALIDNDTRMNAYERDLAAARARLAEAQETMRAYEEDRAALRAEIDDVRDAKAALLETFAGGVSISPLPEGIAPGTDAATEFVQLDLLEHLASLTTEELETLREIRNSALLLRDELDEAIVVVEALAQSVEQNLEGAREHFFGTLDALVTGTADRHIEDYLDAQVSTMARTILEDARWPAEPFVDFLLGGRVDEAALREELLSQLITPESAGAATMRFSFSDDCSDGAPTRLRFHAISSDRQWPSEDTWWRLEDLGDPVAIDLTCLEGEKVCYGASSSAGDWGLGLNGSSWCETCCWTCSDASVSRRLTCD